MLQPNPHNQPKCTELLELNFIKRRIEDSMNEPCKFDLINLNEIKTSNIDMTENLPFGNIEKDKAGKGSKIYHFMKEKTEVLKGKRIGDNAKKREGLKIKKIKHGVDELVSRNPNKGEYLDLCIVGNEINIDKNVLRQNVYNEE